MHRRRLAAISFPIGRGWALNVGKDDIIPCTGAYGAECGRQAGNPCLLNGQNDGKRGHRFRLAEWLAVDALESGQGMPFHYQARDVAAQESSRRLNLCGKQRTDRGMN